MIAPHAHLRIKCVCVCVCLSLFGQVLQDITNKTIAVAFVKTRE